MNGSLDPVDVSLADLHDCDGSRGIHAILIDVSAVWCGSCQAEAPALQAELTKAWSALGIRVVTLVIQDATGAPATLETARGWRDAFKLDAMTVVADPEVTFGAYVPPQGSSLPMMFVIDPRTMRVMERQTSFPFDPSKLLALAAANRGT